MHILYGPNFASIVWKVRSPGVGSVDQLLNCRANDPTHLARPSPFECVATQLNLAADRVVT